MRDVREAWVVAEHGGTLTRLAREIAGCAQQPPRPVGRIVEVMDVHPPVVVGVASEHLPGLRQELHGTDGSVVPRVPIHDAAV